MATGRIILDSLLRDVDKSVFPWMSWDEAVAVAHSMVIVRAVALGDNSPLIIRL